MVRFSVVLFAALALTGIIVVSVSPASAYTGAAYDRCMAKCEKSGVSHRCPYWCQSRN
jgi:hypothetical protein